MLLFGGGGVVGIGVGGVVVGVGVVSTVAGAVAGSVCCWLSHFISIKMSRNASVYGTVSTACCSSTANPFRYV